MVAKIESGKSLMGALMYNERKVSAGKAQLVKARGYAKGTSALSMQDKLQRLTDLADRNHRTKTNTVHISLNFGIGENLPPDRLAHIADEYMGRIGFSAQPYLIYEHKDAGHPHIHIVTTNIQADGKRISLHNIGKLRSEQARKAIEMEFGLLRAGHNPPDLSIKRAEKLKPLQYGISDTKRAITNIVNEITKAYKYTSLPELNAVLALYNVTAYRGANDSVMHKNGGLQYWATNEQGQRVGVPIKASSIYKKPTLHLLERRFKLNEYLRKPLRNSLKSRIENKLSASCSLEQLKDGLKNENIILVVRQNADGRIYGLSFIDLKEKTVFNGSDLGKEYSASAVMARLKFLAASGENRPAHRPVVAASAEVISAEQNADRSRGTDLLHELLDPNDGANTAGDFGPKRKKKKRKKLNL
ncbi:relaxase/mobilization nuclease domain-containing protein [Mucilaginibacter pedocola]|uniref:MobA/VirD2-like nuclease domain-containing protein n=1 Tax=Mucilaginibacter pedocola TaxID=1792845 RepID=A0A1S9PH43_9SPHI|nr:relaxase/mobilization nuclease domain-containing protein [Mucilaginibacter pedocola]OOQ60296.1 hypothetical protein BC343_26450 [Mucilaginibacter pedocola]